MSIRQLVIACLVSLTGCASVPTHYYTLLAPADTAKPQPAVAAEGFQFEMLAVHVPVQADQPQIVLRQGGGSLVLLENERWSMPLSDEIHDALTQQLEKQLSVRDLAGMAKMPAIAQLSLQTDIRRFDSLPGRYALMDVVWTLSLRFSADRLKDTLTCSSTMRQPVGVQVEDLVIAHQQLISRLATVIASTARHWLKQAATECP